MEAINRYHFAIYLSVFFSIFSIFICIVEHEIFLKYGDDKNSTFRFILLWVHLFTTICLGISIYFATKCWLWWRKTLGKLGKFDDLINTKIWKITAFEILINLISPMPFLYKTKYQDFYYVERVSVKIQVNTMLLFFMIILRIYVVTKGVLISTYFMSDRATRVWAIYGVHNGYRYWVRAIFRENPFIFCYINYFFYTIVFGYLFKAIENEANHGNLSTPYFTFQNSLWCSFITMTTVGYGDFFPKTFLGRLVGYWAAFVGVALESLVILTVQSGLRHTMTQLSAYLMIVSLGKKEKLKSLAGKMLVATYRMRHCPKEKHLSLLKNYK